MVMKRVNCPRHAFADCGGSPRPRPQGPWFFFFFFFSTSIYLDSSRAREPLDFSVDLSQKIIGSGVCHLRKERKMNLSSGAALQGSGSQGGGGEVGRWGDTKTGRWKRREA